MKKIPTLFVRDYSGRPPLVTPTVLAGCEWVIEGEGIATPKLDGTACLWRDGRLYGRYDAKAGRTPPPSFAPAQPEPDPMTGHWPGWVPIEETGFRKQADEALRATPALYDGYTYELVGPKVNGNPQGYDSHQLILHGSDVGACANAPRTFDELRDWLTTHPVEGIVWWRDLRFPDCDKVKIKRRDFGLPWP